MFWPLQGCKGRKTMSDPQTGFDTAGADETGSGSQRGVNRIFLTTLWFGLVAGWLELGLVLVEGAVRPRASFDTLRTNRHLVWMVPVSDVLIFSVVGLLIALLARFQQRLAWWIALRLPVALGFLAL